MSLRLKAAKAEFITFMPNQFLLLNVHPSNHPGAEVDNLGLILDFLVVVILRVLPSPNLADSTHPPSLPLSLPPSLPLLIQLAQIKKSTIEDFMY